jgi:hypothetical protein
MVAGYRGGQQMAKKTKKTQQPQKLKRLVLPLRAEDFDRIERLRLRHNRYAPAADRCDRTCVFAARLLRIGYDEMRQDVIDDRKAHEWERECMRKQAEHKSDNE